jgi:hypothetical protein
LRFQIKIRYPALIAAGSLPFEEKEKVLEVYRQSLVRELKRISPTEESDNYFRKLWKLADGNIDIGEAFIKEQNLLNSPIVSQVIKNNKEVIQNTKNSDNKKSFLSWCSRKFGNLFK